MKSLPSRGQALQLLHENHCSSGVIEHCVAVAELAKQTALTLKRKGYNVDVDLVEIGALLHDLGRSQTHTVDHAVAGVVLARKAGLPDAVVSIIKRHVGGGITSAEAKQLGWPNDDYVPTSLEEKIVSYADKLIGTSERIPIDATINNLLEEKHEVAAERVRILYEEVSKLVGDDA